MNAPHKTEPKKTEIERLRSEEQYRQLIEQASDAIFVADLDSRIQDVNHAACTLLRCTRDEIIGKTAEHISPKEEHSKIWQVRAALLEEDSTQILESVLKRKDNSLVPVEISSKILADGRWLAFVRDITERKKAEEKFRALLESAPDAMVIVNGDGNIVLVNEQTEKLFGYSRSEILGQKVEMLVPEHVLPKHPDLRDSYFKNPIPRSISPGTELRARRKNGEEIPVEVSLSPLRTDEGVLITSAVRDIRERKDVERRLKEEEIKFAVASKMAALGEMAAGIGHEINNPLAVIQAVAEDLRERIKKNGIDLKTIDTELHKLQQTCGRIDKIIKGLRTFAREDESSPFKVTKMKEIITDTLSFCGERIKKHNIDLKIHQDLNKFSLECRPVQICQILLNLVNNSMDAIETLPEKWISLEGKDLGDKIEIRVVDSGRGISIENRQKIMQPFFSTKEPGRASGLGLSISKGIAEGHRGALFFDGASKNTAFALRLPKRQS